MIVHVARTPFAPEHSFVQLIIHCPSLGVSRRVCTYARTLSQRSRRRSYSQTPTVSHPVLSVVHLSSTHTRRRLFESGRRMIAGSRKAVRRRATLAEYKHRDARGSGFAMSPKASRNETTSSNGTVNLCSRHVRAVLEDSEAMLVHHDGCIVKDRAGSGCQCPDGVGHAIRPRTAAARG